MAFEKQHVGEIFAARAMAEYEQSASPISIPRIREARDMVYNGTINTPVNGTTTDSNNQPSHNKKHSKRRISPFTFILILIAGAIASVLYISNILAVGHLMAQINQLQTKHQQILNDQELLKAQITRLSSLERIQQIANSQLGLQNPKQLPVWIEIDPERELQIADMIEQQVKQKR
jgi:cell division protein FtsL